MAKKKLPVLPGWGAPPVNGIPQWGRATGGTGTAIFPQGRARLAVLGAPAPQPGGGGGNPYSGILNEFLNSSKARFAADSAADAASRDAALQRFIISYGQVPDFAKLGISDSAKGFLQGALSDKVKQLAEQNTKEGTSVYARQAKADEVARRRIPAMLAARGMLRSGQTGADFAEQQQAYKNQSFDTLNEMLGGMEGTVGNFLQAERQRAEMLAQAELQAQMAAYQNYGGDMHGDPTSTGPGSTGPRSGPGGTRPVTRGRPTYPRGNAALLWLRNRQRAGRM